MKYQCDITGSGRNKSSESKSFSVSLGPLQTHMTIFWVWNWVPALGG